MKTQKPPGGGFYAAMLLLPQFSAEEADCFSLAVALN
jgi:hypothetical protein